MDYYATKLRWIAGSDNIASLLIIVIFSALIANCLFIDKGYYDTMATDLFGFIDGIYRAHLSQVPHRDFSTVEGAIQFLVPAFFIDLGADLVSSIRYYHAALLVLALCIVVYLQRTRIDNLPAIFLGGLIALALACKYNFGDSPFQVTEAMFYNRIGYAFLTLELILFVRPKPDKKILIIADGVVIGLICGLLFYVKITFGVVALAFVFLNLLADCILLRSKLTSLGVTVAAFFLVVIVIEVALGGQFSWYRDIRMAMLSDSGANLRRHLIFHKLAVNAPEIVVGIVSPFVILGLSGTKIKMYWVIYALAIASSSVLLQMYSAQESVLFLPIAFIIFAKSKLEGGLRFNALTRPPSYSLAMIFLSLFAMATIGYPMLVNVVFASESFHHGDRLASTSSVLSSIRTQRPQAGEPGILTSSQTIEMVESAAPLDGYMMARSSRPAHHFDLLSFPEVALYLDEGLKAANSGCRKGSRIATLDFVNPFPALLGWPEGGGMIFVADKYLMSKAHHLSDEEMFRQIDCVLIPKLQLGYGTRELLTNIYGSYLQANFLKTGETELWTVLSTKS
jgi:hypothetical protein